MAFMMTRVQVDDYEAWKPMFDSDPVGAREKAKGHRIFRTVEDPNEVSIAVEFDSPEDAREARQRLVDEGVFDRVTVKVPPTIVEETDAARY